MNRAARIALVVVLCSLAVAVPAIWAYWIKDGVPICTDASTQQYPDIVSDDAGGAIVTWADNREGYSDIYVQRINNWGVVQWTVDGLPICAAVESQYNPQIASDGSGGAIITWYDYRSLIYPDIYAQRVDASGAVMWITDGIAVCTESHAQYNPQIITDGSGGAIIAWRDVRSGNNDIYAQRINSAGIVQWPTDGVPVCTAAGSQEETSIISDGAGGAIVAWRDYRLSDWAIYAQRIDASGTYQWTLDGVSICTAVGEQYAPRMTSDGSGGAIITWEDTRNGSLNNDIYAQRINSSGTIEWTANGIGICTVGWVQQEPQIISDGAGGAIVTWHDYRNGSDTNIYAQRINSSGTEQWTTDGVALCTASGDQHNPRTISDGTNGAIVTWSDGRSGSHYDIYSQHINASGAVQWIADGVPLCTAVEHQMDIRSTSDGAGGAIACWRDYRSSGWDLYAQWIDSEGRVAYFPPVISSVTDVPGDEGGWVRISIGRASWDQEDWSTLISMYNVWQRVDDPALLTMISREAVEGASAASWPLEEWNGRRFLRSGDFPPGTWELLGSFAACQQDEYIYRASTLADSTAGGIPYSVYIVSAHTTDPLEWSISAPDSGYSVDNLPPCTPAMLAGQQQSAPDGLQLTWQPNCERDLFCYNVYRGIVEWFVPGPGNLLDSTCDASFFDGGWTQEGGFHYKVSAVDIHDNESDFALLRPDDVTDVDVPETPVAVYLHQNFPNPFNPVTKIRFGLPQAAHVRLCVYNVKGELVATLIDRWMPEGRKEISWTAKDSRGHAVTSGIYFYCLNAGGFVQMRKMVLMR
jgi:predicted lipoprotein with Yx(FWY)xxD motif